MAIKSVYDRAFTLKGWFGTTQELESWFDREWVAGAGGTIVPILMSQYRQRGA